MPRTYRDISNEVKNGEVAIRLLRPPSYLGTHAAIFFSSTLFRFGFALLIGGATTWWFVGPPPIASWQVLVVLPLLLILTFALHFCIAAMVGLASFWVEDVTGIWFAIDKTKWILGGLLLPIEVFPSWLRQITDLLPFRHMLYGPAHLMLRFSWPEALSLFGQQAAWLAVFIGLLTMEYRSASRTIAVNGG
jgi:ABC-2 type transport system permease protein